MDHVQSPSRTQPIRCIIGTCRISLALAVAGMAFTGDALAGCGQYNPLEMQVPASPHSPFPLAGGMMETVYRPGSEQMLPVRDDRDDREPGIVGTWRFTMVSDGTSYPVMIPYGAVVDFGTAQWHTDGTEFMISGARAPSSGDVCMGSWEQVGPSTFKLKHIALAWSSGDSIPPTTPAAYLGPAIIKETVMLNHARSGFEGTFTLDQYAKDEITLLQHISGKITATRFAIH